jgi:hypothetical protein
VMGLALPALRHAAVTLPPLPRHARARRGATPCRTLCNRRPV